jgi:hypothetical protein
LAQHRGGAAPILPLPLGLGEGTQLLFLTERRVLGGSAVLDRDGDLVGFGRRLAVCALMTQEDEQPASAPSRAAQATEWAKASRDWQRWPYMVRSCRAKSGGEQLQATHRRDHQRQRWSALRKFGSGRGFPLRMIDHPFDDIFHYLQAIGEDGGVGRRFVHNRSRS